jgi:hypothetical protein
MYASFQQITQTRGHELRDNLTRILIHESAVWRTARWTRNFPIYKFFLDGYDEWMLHWSRIRQARREEQREIEIKILSDNKKKKHLSGKIC